MTSEIEGDVRKNLLDRSDAEKVFRPWWDTAEDYLLNCLIGLGRFLCLWKQRVKKSTAPYNNVLARKILFKAS